MTEAQTAFSRRGVACRGWRWMPGMLACDGYRMLWCSDTEREWAGPQFTQAGMAWRYARIHGEPHLPDLTDPATLGCLLALVREAWGQDDLVAFRFGGAWCAEVTPQEAQHHAFYGSTEAEALVAALESAP